MRTVMDAELEQAFIAKRSKIQERKRGARAPRVVTRCVFVVRF